MSLIEAFAPSDTSGTYTIALANTDYIASAGSGQTLNWIHFYGTN